MPQSRCVVCVCVSFFLFLFLFLVCVLVSLSVHVFVQHVIIRFNLHIYFLICCVADTDPLTWLTPHALVILKEVITQVTLLKFV